MIVAMAAAQAISILRGGPLTQIRKTAEHLGGEGVSVTFFDGWGDFRKENVDLVHLFGTGLGTYHLARELATLGTPVALSPIVFSTHTPRFVRGGLSVSRSLRRAWPGLWTDYSMAADQCRWAGIVLPNSQAEADLVIGGYGIDPSKVTVVPNGVDPRFAHGDPSLFERTYGVKDFILNVGHIGHGRKNVLALIKALGGIDHPAVIVGRIVPGPYGDACVAEAKRHKQILLLEAIDNESEMLASAYAACRVFVLPSLFETPGIAALEAGLAGARVVITPFGGPKEYFGELAVYVDPQSVDSIRGGIRKALDMPRSDLLRRRILERYTWKEVARLTAVAYKRVASGPAHP